MSVSITITPELHFGARWSRQGNALAARSAFVGDTLLSGEALAACFENAGSELTELPQRLNGFFAAVCVTDEHIFAAADKIRSTPVFYLLRDGRVLLSDDPRWIREESGLSQTDGTAENELLLTRYITGPDTLYAQIKQLQAGEYLYIDRSRELDAQIPVKRYYTFRSGDAQAGKTKGRTGGRRELDALVEQNIQALEQAFHRLARYAAGRPVAVPLSGGYDSRLVALMLKRIRYDHVLTFTFGRQGNEESRVSRQVAAHLGLPWICIPYHTDNIYRMTNSEEWKRYNRMADGLCCTCFDRDWPAVWMLKKDGLIPEDAVIVPGHSGDYIGGGHIREGFAQKKTVSPEEFVGEILNRHYTMWKWGGMERTLRPEFAEKILRVTGVGGDMGREQACDAYERWVWQEFQAKYLVNGVRVYEFWGYDWWLPLWDTRYMEFWSAIPLRWRLGKRLYNETVFRLYAQMAGISYREAQIRENSVGVFRTFRNGATELAKTLIRNSPVKPAAAAVRKSLEGSRPSLPRGETWELDWEQCQGRLNKKLYDALAPYMTNRSSSVTLEKLGHIRFDDEEVSPEVIRMLARLRGSEISANPERAAAYEQR